MAGGIRIGVDVGGTFTHAVAVDRSLGKVVAAVCEPTTHAAPNGVAEGILCCLRRLIEEKGILREDVRFIAHSTTQATNALLEGDLAPVTLVGLLEGGSTGRAKKEMTFEPGPVAGGKPVRVRHVWIAAPDCSQTAWPDGAVPVVCAVAAAFSVDDPRGEKTAADSLRRMGIPATATHEVSGLYGLRARTRTAIINAAILPKMTETCEKTLQSVRALGLSNDLMVMRSDGGVMSALQMRESPILTMLSGPAAGVSAAILFEKMSNGIFVEVGGTSADISLIVDGAPRMKNASVGSETIYLKTLDVRTTAVAGGSMPRTAKGKIIGAGPRSAHIAGLPYACFQEAGVVSRCKARQFAPTPSDADDYLVLESDKGERYAVTNTCAANFLGLIPESDYARANMESAGEAFNQIGSFLGTDPKEAAQTMLDAGVSAIRDICRALLREYKKENAQWELVGGGGGASVVVHRLGEMMGVKARVARDAEVISAVGAAMAMLRSTMEKSVVDPGEADIRAVREALREDLIRQGAAPETIEIQIEVDRRKNVVSGAATGSTELRTGAESGAASPEEALKKAAEALETPENKIKCLYDDLGTRAFVGERRSGGALGIGARLLHPVAVVSQDGVVRLRMKNGAVVKAGGAEVEEALSRLFSLAENYGDGGAALRNAHLVVKGKIVNLTALGERDAIERAVREEVGRDGPVDVFCLVVEK